MRPGAPGAALAALVACALVACVPPTSLPPPVPSTGDLSAGAALSGGWGHRPAPAGADDTGPVLDLSVWAAGRLDRWEVGALAYTGVSSQVGGAVFGRRWVSAPGAPVQVAPQLELGSSWLGLALPLAWSPRPQLWLTTQPALRVSAQLDRSFTPLAVAPLGVAVQRSERLVLLGEVGARVALSGARCEAGATLSPYGQYCLGDDGAQPAQPRELTLWASVGARFSPLRQLP